MTLIGQSSRFSIAMKNPSNFSDKKLFVRGIWSVPLHERFGIVDNESDDWCLSSWEKCREDFYAFTKDEKLTRLLFSAPPIKHTAIAAFFEKLETRLGVQPRTQFGRTQIENVIWIRPSVWWTGMGMRRSLFTAFLRGSIKYSRYKKNFEEAMYSEKYLDQTREAVGRFLEGYTCYTGNVVGWHSQFYDGGQWMKGKPDEKRLQKLLVRPKNNVENAI
jgi:hypothetical protein